MADDTFVFDEKTARQFADSASPMLGIAIAPDWMPAVIQNLRANAAAAQLVTSFPLDDELESASVFRA